MTTGRDRVAASRRASHCSSYVALNLPSPFQILRVHSRHDRSADISNLHPARSITDVRVIPFIRNIHASVTISSIRAFSRQKRDSIFSNIVINREIFKYSVIRAIAIRKRGILKVL